MENANNPQNQKPNGPHDLGQITKKHNPKPWAVVENAGMNDEDIAGDFATFAEANRAVKNWYYPDEVRNMNIQIMRRRDDGVLTTEY